MQDILAFFDWFGNLCMTIFDFVVGLIEDLITMLEYVGVAATNAFDMIANLPDWMQGFAIITITISIIFVIVGRNAGKSKGE